MRANKIKHLSVSVDSYPGWPNALFSLNPTTDKVLEFSVNYIAAYEIQKRKRTDPGTVFKNEKFN